MRCRSDHSHPAAIDVLWRHDASIQHASNGFHLLRRGEAMSKRLLRLYPGPVAEQALRGRYLEHRLHKLGTQERPFVYANFLSSLDGRIAVEDSDGDHAYIPEHISTDSDLRLFLELQAQADCLITHGGYLRALSEGRLGNILQVGAQAGAEDLLAWRKEQGLPAQPAVVIASASLDFPLHPSLQEHGQAVYIATGRGADPQRVSEWRERGCRILFAGDTALVEGRPLVESLRQQGLVSLYLIAGPQMLDTMVRQRQLSRLYHTTTHQLVGGADFHTMMPGPMLGAEGRLRLRSLYYDADAPAGSGQFFAQFDVAATL
jgi:riboflavin biosynthesis pyrimidine reductase